MSDHNKPQSLALMAALRLHGLSYDVPSQLSDAFRHGFNYQQKRIAELEAQLLKLQTHNNQAIRYGERYETPCDKADRN